MFEKELIGWTDRNTNPLSCGDKVRLFGKDEYTGEIAYDETGCMFVVWIENAGVWTFDELDPVEIERI